MDVGGSRGIVSGRFCGPGDALAVVSRPSSVAMPGRLRRSSGGARAAVLVGAVCLGAPASPADAQESRRGAYVGIEQGVAGSSALRGVLTGNSQPTRCDSLLYAAGVPDGTDCPLGAPREIYRTDFDLGAGFAAGVVGGYGWRWIRVEAEYLRQHSGSSTSLIASVDRLVATEKAREWSESASPFAQVSDVLSQQAFVNVYIDAVNGSRWTPYFGAGAGAVRTSLGYGNRYVRQTLAQGYSPAGGVDPLTATEIPEWQRNAAGTVSAVETRIAETRFGLQVLGGADYAMNEHVSITFKARWSRFASIDSQFLWDLVRSHEPVLADGETPYDLGLKLDGFWHVLFTLGLQYHF